MTTKHTKGELTADGWNGRAGICIWDKDLNHIFTVERLSGMRLVDQQELAEELLSRWNSHDDLMGLTMSELQKQLKQAKKHLSKHFLSCGGSNQKIGLAHIDAAIAEAKWESQRKKGLRDASVEMLEAIKNIAHDRFDSKMRNAIVRMKLVVMNSGKVEQSQQSEEAEALKEREELPCKRCGGINGKHKQVGDPQAGNSHMLTMMQCPLDYTHLKPTTLPDEEASDVPS